MAVNIINADVFAGLKGLGDDSIDGVCTSPPYWGLRDYGVAGQIGLEPTLSQHLGVMVRVFREVKRIMKPDAILWLNYGDCYATQPNGTAAKDITASDCGYCDKPFSTVQGTLKAKDLCMMPNRLAIALQEDGWWVRSEIIWEKPNPMPESAKDRPGGAHEKIFMLTKKASYRYDHLAVRQQSSGTKCNEIGGWAKDGAHSAIAHNKPNKPKKISGDLNRTRHQPPGNAPANGHKALNLVPQGQGRNLRNVEPAPMQVWKIPPLPFKAAHFATFPPELVERCFRASGLKPGHHVLDPFGGAGTTGLMADKLGLKATLIELNPDYVKIATNRLRAGLVRLDGDIPLSDDLFDVELQKGAHL